MPRAVERKNADIFMILVKFVPQTMIGQIRKAAKSSCTGYNAQSTHLDIAGSWTSGCDYSILAESNGL